MLTRKPLLFQRRIFDTLYVVFVNIRPLLYVPTAVYISFLALELQEPLSTINSPTILSTPLVPDRGQQSCSG